MKQTFFDERCFIQPRVHNTSICTLDMHICTVLDVTHSVNVPRSEWMQMAVWCTSG